MYVYRYAGTRTMMMMEGSRKEYDMKDKDLYACPTYLSIHSRKKRSEPMV